MQSDELEQAYAAFLDSEVYDRAEAALFDLIRLAFRAGWDAAKRDNIKILEF